MLRTLASRIFNSGKTNVWISPNVSTVEPHRATSPTGQQHFTATASSLTPKRSKISAAMIEAEIELPPKPRKPLNAWQAFVMERKDALRTQKPGMTAPEIVSILSREWKTIDRSSYETDYHTRRDEYLRQKESYEKSLGDEQRQYIELLKNIKQQSKISRALNKTKPPTLPRTLANLYCMERCKDPDIREEIKGQKGVIVFGKLYNEFKLLSEHEKEKYVQRREQDKERFSREFVEWYEGIQTNTSLSAAVRAKADHMFHKYKTLKYF